MTLTSAEKAEGSHPMSALVRALTSIVGELRGTFGGENTEQIVTDAILKCGIASEPVEPGWTGDTEVTCGPFTFVVHTEALSDPPNGT